MVNLECSNRTFLQLSFIFLLLPRKVYFSKKLSWYESLIFDLEFRLTCCMMCKWRYQLLNVLFKMYERNSNTAEKNLSPKQSPRNKHFAFTNKKRNKFYFFCQLWITANPMFSLFSAIQHFLKMFLLNKLSYEQFFKGIYRLLSNNIPSQVETCCTFY